MRLFRSLAAMTATLGFAAAMPATARPALVSSSPAAAATTSNVRTVTLIFDEAFLPQLSGLEVVMIGMPGMEGHHPAMNVSGVKVTSGPDRKSLIATLARPLPAGTYDVNWHAVGDDTHRIAGKVSFTVR